jgi:hypothetical protein
MKRPMKKTSLSCLDHWHNGGDIEIQIYARALHKAAKGVIENLSLEPNPVTAWDACPAIPLYRLATELHLKALVDEGNNFLPVPTDHITLYKTHSLRWLAQIVCQIIRSVGWQEQFQCDGATSLVEFSARISELESLDPVTCAIHSRRRDGSIPPQLQPAKIVQLAEKLDAILTLLEATTDALAAEAMLMDNELDSNPTIQ